MFYIYLPIETVMKVNKFYPLYSLILLVGLLGGCASSAQITSVAEKSKDGNIILKWEVNPDQDGNINIYSANSDSSLDDFMSVKTTNISDQVTEISIVSPETREFFILRTSTAYSGIISNRVIEMSNVKNFRDLGGYYTDDNKQLRWGKVFRSGDLSSATLYDQERIRRLGVKTIIDFRSEKTTKKYPILIHPHIRKVSLAITPMDLEKMDEQIEDEKLTRSDAIRYVQDSYVGIVENYKNEFKEMFNLMTDENNYPILLVGSLGKDRVGLASAFILYALGVPEKVIEEDYLFSNKTIDISKVVEDAHTLPEYMQEAVTALLTVNSAYFTYAIDHIKQKYGSIDKYLEKELNVTHGKKILLRKYLLYNQ